jgi:hypothetical protein
MYALVVLPLLCCGLIIYGLYKIDKFVKGNGGFTNEKYIWIHIVLLLAFAAAEVMYAVGVAVYYPEFNPDSESRDFTYFYTSMLI